MTRTKLLLLSPVLVAGVLTLFAPNLPVRAADDTADATLSAQLVALQTQVAKLQAIVHDNQAKLAPVELSFDEINGLAGPHMIITGVNLHLRSGSGATDTAVNGLGNLIVGYNELAEFTLPRIGSHNLVVGRANSYTSFGGLVAGAANDIIAPYATVTGGRKNLASGFASSVSGGEGRKASELFNWSAGALFESN